MRDLVATSPAKPSLWGRCDAGIVEGATVGGMFRLVVVGAAEPTGLTAELYDAAKMAVREQLALGRCIGDVSQDLARVVRRVDRGVRQWVQHDASRGTMVCCAMVDDRAWFAHSGRGDVCLLRDGTLQRLVGLPKPLSAQVPWMGAREPGTELASVGIWASEVCVHLQEGDRLVLSSASLEPVFDLVRLAGGGPVGIAAEAVAQVLRRREGLEDVAVAILDWSPDLVGSAPSAPPSTPNLSEPRNLGGVPTNQFGQRDAVTDPMEFPEVESLLQAALEESLQQQLTKVPPFRSVQREGWVQGLVLFVMLLGFVIGATIAIFSP